MKNLIINSNIIYDYLRKNNLSVKKFCKICNISYYQFHKMLTNISGVYSNVLFNVCKTMNIKLKDLISIKK